MKKGLKIALIGLCLLGLTSCSFPYYVRSEKSAAHFLQYKQELSNIAESYGFTLEDVKSLYIDSKINDYVISLDENSTIEIRLSNKSNSEYYHISYINNLSEAEAAGKEINLDLLLAVVNTVSRTQFLKADCEAFLQAPEDDYPSSSYGLEKLENELISKKIMKDFFESWSMDYKVYLINNEIKEDYSFSGYMKRYQAN